jgi:ribosomal protein S18 acetylase RimI-like enzyme
VNTPTIIRYLLLPDLPQVAAVHRAAFPESLFTALGLEATRRYYEWQLLGPHDVTALGVFVGLELKGFLFGGVFKGAMAGFLRQHRGYLGWCVLANPRVWLHQTFRTRLREGSNILRKPINAGLPQQQNYYNRRKSFGILSIAVDPKSQRSGIGRMMMQVAETVAHNRTFQEMHLTVHPKNQAAVSFYERLGWEKILENGSFQGYMRKLLTS